ncbi:SRPBCC domain-containing protein [bacterium]|nr:SRPBCC domain-containing protein [bacterium]
MSVSNTRHVEKTVEIDVPVSDVWKALTDAEELKCWFPIDAEVEPGMGGKIRIAWRDEFEWVFHIETWDDEKHLRLVYDPAEDFTASSILPSDSPENTPNQREPAGPLTVDYHLEGKEGGTILRLVHSGFGLGANWDQEYDSVSRGWSSELISLRHYLQAHRGKKRDVAWAKATISQPADLIWAKLIGEKGLVVKGSLTHLREGDSYDIKIVTGHRLKGRVQFINPPKDFSGSVQNMNNGIFRFWIDRFGDRTIVNIWLSTYGIPKSDVREFEDKCKKILHKLFS